MINKILTLSAVLAVILLLSCSKAADSTIKKEDSPRVYNFSLTPYDSVPVPDKALYNYIFNIIRNKLVYYVENTLPSHPELIGTLMELKQPSGQGRNFEVIINGSIVRGWNIYDTDTVPIPDADIALLNSGNPPEGNVLIPKARYVIKYSENSAAVYVRYWMLQYRNYDFVYFLEKNPSWSLVKTEEIQ